MKIESKPNSLVLSQGVSTSETVFLFCFLAGGIAALYYMLRRINARLDWIPVLVAVAAITAGIGMREGIWFEFDLTTHQLRWRRSRFFIRSAGNLAFSEIQQIRHHCTGDSDGRTYSVDLLTAVGTGLTVSETGFAAPEAAAIVRTLAEILPNAPVISDDIQHLNEPNG